MKEIINVTVTSKRGLERLETLIKKREEGIEKLKADYKAGKFDKYFNQV